MNFESFLCTSVTSISFSKLNQWDVELKVPNVTMKSLGHFHFHCQMDLMKYCNQDLEVVLRPGQTDLWLACAQQGKGIGKKSSYIPLKETPLFPSHQYKRNHFCFHTFYLCTCVFLELDQMIDWQLRSVTLPLDNVTKLRSEWFFSSDSIDRTGHFFPMPIRKDEKDSRSKRGRKWIDCVIFQIIKHRNVFCLGSHQDILTCPTKSTGASYDTIKHGSSYCLSLLPAFCFF